MDIATHSSRLMFLATAVALTGCMGSFGAPTPDGERFEQPEETGVVPTPACPIDPVTAAYRAKGHLGWCAGPRPGPQSGSECPVLLRAA